MIWRGSEWETGREWESGRGGDFEIGRVGEGENGRVQSLNRQYSFRSTRDIMDACEAGELPDKIMFNFHPQRWTDNPVLWTQELVWQNVKNVVKWFLVRDLESGRL